MSENEIARAVVDSAIKVHKEMGPGLLESVYESCLYFELTNRGFNVTRQKIFPLIFNEIKLDYAYRADLYIENKFIVEIKSVRELNDVHLAQTITYLRLSKCKLGLLLNFNVSLMKNGIKRVVNKL